jgi:hypothetical protein
MSMLDRMRAMEIPIVTVDLFLVTRAEARPDVPGNRRGDDSKFHFEGTS